MEIKEREKEDRKLDLIYAWLLDHSGEADRTVKLYEQSRDSFSEGLLWKEERI